MPNFIKILEFVDMYFSYYMPLLKIKFTSYKNDKIILEQDLKTFWKQNGTNKLWTNAVRGEGKIYIFFVLTTTPSFLVWQTVFYFNILELFCFMSILLISFVVSIKCSCNIGSSYLWLLWNPDFWNNFKQRKGNLYVLDNVGKAEIDNGNSQKGVWNAILL